jgi:hypothetical protein
MFVPLPTKMQDEKEGGKKEEASASNFSPPKLRAQNAWTAWSSDTIDDMMLQPTRCGALTPKRWGKSNTVRLTA